MFLLKIIGEGRSGIQLPTSTIQSPAEQAGPAVATENKGEAAAPVDPVAAEYDRISNQIPRTEEQKKEALKLIEDAYYNLGDIYYFKLLEKENAVITYNKLLRSFSGD